MQIGDTVTDEVVVPTYPVVQYGHVPTGGDGIGSGYVYTGKALPVLRGKYVFSDLSTGRFWYADFKEMLAADDGDPDNARADARAEDPLEGAGVRHVHADCARRRIRPGAARIPIFPGAAPSPARSAPTRGSPIDAKGELYIYSKTDGMIRQVVGAE